MDFQEKIKVLAEEWQGNNEKRCVIVLAFEDKGDDIEVTGVGRGKKKFMADSLVCYMDDKNEYDPIKEMIKDAIKVAGMKSPQKC